MIKARLAIRQLLSILINTPGPNSGLHMFTRQKQNLSNRIAIDPGASRTRFYSPTGGLLLDQPSVAALDMDHPVGGASAVKAFGNQAIELLTQSAAQRGNLKRVHPVQADRHNDLGLSTKMLGYFLSNAKRDGLITRAPEVVVLAPHDGGQSVESALQRKCLEAGAGTVDVQNTATALFNSAVLKTENLSGNGTRKAQPDRGIIIDFGATGSRLFAMSHGEVVYHQNLSCGGDELDRVIVAGLLERFGLQVSDETANEIKHTVGAATPQSLVQCSKNSHQVNCLSVKTNAMTSFRIGSDTVNEILQPTLASLNISIRLALSEIDSSIKDAAYESGIRLSGGGAMLKRMDQLVMSATDLPVEVVNRPLSCSVRGAASVWIEAQTEPSTEEILAEEEVI